MRRGGTGRCGRLLEAARSTDLHTVTTVTYSEGMDTATPPTRPTEVPAMHTALDTYRMLDFELAPFAAQAHINTVADVILAGYGPAAVKAGIAGRAAHDHARYRQYDGHWAGTEWKLARCVRDVIGKGGLRFAVGDIVIVDTHSELHRPHIAVLGDRYWTAYSVRGKINCSVTSTDFELIG